MSGLLINERFVAVFPSLVRTLGSLEAAVILQHLHFNADEAGDIRITVAQISDDTGVGLRTVERRLKLLRDEGWVAAERSGSYDATLTYRIDHAKLSGTIPASGGVESAKLAGSESDRVADSSSKKTEVPTSVVSNEPRVRTSTPEQHPSRAITAEWFPRAPFASYLREEYPHVDLLRSITKFVNFHIARQSTSKSHEALLENWISDDNARAARDLVSGTDDLGIPKTQGRKSKVADAPKPGDPDYFDPIAYLTELQKRTEQDTV